MIAIDNTAIAADREALARFYQSPNVERHRTPAYEPFPFKTFAAIVGGSKWVIARRTPNIIARYGESVVCLSQKRYAEAERLARLMLTEGLD